ncbi:DUF721 domain-containing protein [Patescibacteria group bacterium]|nr:DUF721 domain-containing protein [Patescibacteria group bacterium]MBU1921629.1 DUF721 domain-containing protein [Patescibacteria group bacterium]
MAKPLKQLLDEAIKRTGLGRGVLAAMVCEEFKKVCTELHGQDVFGYIKHVSFQNGDLKIKCASSAVAQNLTINKTRLINEINQGLGSQVVKNLFALVF